MTFPGCETAALMGLAVRLGIEPHGLLGDKHQQAMVAWWKCESGADGTKGGTNNPWAVTRPYNGATDFNSSGVKNYKTRFDGAHEMIETLMQSNYADLRTTLVKSDLDLEAFCTAIGNAPEWTSEACVRSVLGL